VHDLDPVAFLEHALGMGAARYQLLVNLDGDALPAELELGDQASHRGARGKLTALAVDLDPHRLLAGVVKERRILH
jgi:hypothetical protein